MKKRFRSIIAALTAVTVIAFGSMSVSATTAADVVAAARGAGIHSTYVAQLENFLAANEFTSNQYDMMIDGLGSIGNISLSVIQRYFPEIQSIEDFYNGPSSSDDDSNTDPTDTTNPGTIINGTLTPDEEDIKDKADQILDSMTTDDMLAAIDELIETGKQVGLDITAEQVGDKAFTITVKDKDGNIKLVAPIGQLVSRTGAQAVSTESDNTVAVASLGILAAGIAGMAFLNRKNRETGAN